MSNITQLSFDVLSSIKEYVLITDKVSPHVTSSVGSEKLTLSETMYNETNFTTGWF